MDNPDGLARSNQLSLLSRGPLFDPQVQEQYLEEMRTRSLPGEGARVNALREWTSALDSVERGKETSLEQHFNQKVLVETLGYRLYPGGAATAWPKAPTSATRISGEPDVCLGRFEAEAEPQFSAVLELKTPRTDLDAPQARARALTPVQQAFDYGEQMLGVRWVLVTDMRRMRLYSVESPHEFVEFDLRDCALAEPPSRSFKDLYWLVSEEALTQGGADSPVSHLFDRSAARQLSIRDSFYEVYDEIRTDLLGAITEAAKHLPTEHDPDDIVAATQRLLDRMLFLYYCEDNPSRLIPSDTVKSVTESARKMLGASNSKVYDQLKLLFREIDTGSPPGAAVSFAAYNGELFKHDPILDEIDIPDSLHDKTYKFAVPDGGERREVQGVWGLHAFDFWRELNEHLLGHIFERSLSDLEDLISTANRGANRLRRRRQHGIYYTSELLSDFLSGSALTALLREAVPLPDARVTKREMVERLQTRSDHLGHLRIVDLACGSGAFLVSSYQTLLEEFWRLQDALDALSPRGPDLLSQSSNLTQSQLLRDALHGVDLLPQAVELAKLALWLRSARKGEKVADLRHNIVSTDSLQIEGMLEDLNSKLGTFDLVIGNPPWGAEVDSQVVKACCETLGLDPTIAWDSWELFVALGLACLREGGRLAFVLPDTIFSPEKARARRLILESGSIELLHNLGIDWFEGVRMGTVVVQIRRGPLPMGNNFPALLLAGEDRRKAIEGKVPLSQLVSRFARTVPQDRSIASATAEIEVSRSARDDAVMETMESHGRTLSALCEHGRGEEMAKSGLLWICQNCYTPTVPARKAKRDRDDPEARRYQEKPCPGCGLTLNEENVAIEHLVMEGSSTTGESAALFIDGDDITTRYGAVIPNKLLRLDFDGFDFKTGDRYERPKVLIRQAGVGLLATLDETGARCPQSVYYYRLTAEGEAEGYTNEFLLGVLLSRTIAYYAFKRFGEVDPAKAHPKVTHDRLSRLPVPAVVFGDLAQKRLHDEVVEKVRLLLNGKAKAGGHEDMRIDVALRQLWGLSADDGLYINLELARLPEGQVIRELFPNGAPRIVVSPSDNGSEDGAAAVEVVGAS